MSKKIGLIAVLALAMVLIAATLALGAQNAKPNGPDNGINDFANTPSVFNPDGNSNYPDEIYLPNEQDPTAYKIHSNYTSTTDACASCHATHTGVGEALLQWGSVYDTCMACHDGTVSTTYNVVDGEIANTDAPTAGGLFGHGDEASLSNHNVTGALSVYAAPGGPGTAGAANTAPWDSEFTCASCHSPHGMGGNARLLNPDVNGAATAAYNTGTTKGIALLPDGDNKYHTDYNNDGFQDTWLFSGHGYSDKVAVYAGSGAKLASTAYTLSNANGYTVITIDPANAAGPFKADFIAAIQVKMQVDNYLTADETVQQINGLNSFCSACHVDYNTSNVSSPHANLNGTYTEAYRHKVGFDRTKSLATLTPLNMKLEANNNKNNVTCETCHFAHGTDQAFWEKELESVNNGSLPTGFTADNLFEEAGSSALKRLPNMAVCEACHQKGAAAQGYGQAITPVSDVTGNSAGGGYVGMTACGDCHGSMYEHYNETWHPDISRPGLTASEAAQAAKQYGDGSLDAIIPGFEQAIKDTQAELAKVGFDNRGRLKLDSASWFGKGVVADNVKVWSAGTDTGSEIMVRGSVINEDPNKWYIAAILDSDGKIITSGTEPEDYSCGTRGCHTTGYAVGGKLSGASSDFTVWLNAAAGGKKLPFELGVTCEACHGQGGNHVKAPSATNIINPANYSTRVQTVGTQADGKGTFTVFDSTQAYFDYINGVGNAKSCGQCHNSAHHQADFFTQSGINPATGKSALVFPTTPGLNAHFLGSSDGTDSGTTVAGCNTCHNAHEESADPGQLSKATIAETCQQCHSTRGNKNPDGSINGLTFEAGSTTRIIHTFP